MSEQRIPRGLKTARNDKNENLAVYLKVRLFEKPNLPALDGLQNARNQKRYQYGSQCNPRPLVGEVHGVPDTHALGD
jgi:hypothetical protein